MSFAFEIFDCLISANTPCISSSYSRPVSHVMHADSLERPPECHAVANPSRRVAESIVPARAYAAFTFFIVGR